MKDGFWESLEGWPPICGFFMFLPPGEATVAVVSPRDYIILERRDVEIVSLDLGPRSPQALVSGGVDSKRAKELVQGASFFTPRPFPISYGVRQKLEELSLPSAKKRVHRAAARPPSSRSRGS